VITTSTGEETLDDFNNDRGFSDASEKWILG
jgi:hypothetical protein